MRFINSFLCISTRRISHGTNSAKQSSSFDKVRICVIPFSCRNKSWRHFASWGNKNLQLLTQKEAFMMNTTTTITLNDRFSMIKKSNGFQQQQPQHRGRSRSRSRSRQQPLELRGSRRNQRLLTQLEKQHKMRLALKLKNVSVKRDFEMLIFKLFDLSIYRRAS